MKNFFRNTWVQVIFFGLVIGLIFIVVDNKYKFFNSNKDERVYKGPVEVDKDKTYFTKAEYSEFEYNFGKVNEGDTVGHVFKLKNIGKEPLIIYKSRGSCDCIGAFSSGKNIMPDSTEDIMVYFKTKGRKGPQIKTVSIITNTDPSEAVLTFKGEVE
jgi:hypothetical protein